VNGRFLTQALSGMQRYALELVGAVDEVNSRRDEPLEVVVLTPDLPIDTPDWKTIQIRRCGRTRGHLWEQVDLYRASADGLLISLCTSGPVLHGAHILAMHDANVFVHPEFFTQAYGRWHRTIRPLLAKRAKALITVSEFSRGELARHCNVQASKFTVIPDSAEHILSVPADDRVLARLGVTPGSYCLAVGNQSPNKNIAEAVDAFAACGVDGFKLVVAGGMSGRVFAPAEIRKGHDIVMAGRVTDEELRTLYSNAALFVFPSIYEGFGIPPLEAISLGCPVIARSGSAVPGVLGDAAVYYHTPAELQSKLRSALTGGLEWNRRAMLDVSRTYSWVRSAERLIALIESQTANSRVKV
jgi:glycosyltransferase involved in cell wall biosynthesis